MMVLILFQAHDNIRRKPFLHIDVPYAIRSHNVNAATVAAQKNVAVLSFRNGKTLRIQNTVLRTVGGNDTIVLNDVYAAGERHKDLAVAAFADAPDAVGQQSVFFGEGRHLAMRISKQAMGAPERKPQLILAVPDDRADTATLKQRDQILRPQIRPAGCDSLCERKL